MEPKVLTATRNRVECELVENLPLRLTGAKGRRVQCLSGVAWITAYDQPFDVFLRPGRTYVIPNGGLVLAEAVGNCTIRVDLPRSFDYAGYRTRLPVAVARALNRLQLALFRRKPAL
ncbi:MAG TPA: DUF2917 domain-containing protein [Noviherbaspirillum sp.]|nr:DUF2917 domain-containing protein [Noviherbaspirillum sp.]